MAMLEILKGNGEIFSNKLFKNIKALVIMHISYTNGTDDYRKGT